MASTDLHPHGKGLTSTAAGTEEVTVLRLHGEIDLANCPDLDHALRTGGEHIVVDLSDVTLLSAAAIGVLVARAQRVAEAGGQLRIANANPTVGQLLRLIGADGSSSVMTAP